MTIDTSAEAVERLAVLLEEANGFTLLERSKGIAATLRALLRKTIEAERERDAARAGEGKSNG